MKTNISSILEHYYLDYYKVGRPHFITGFGEIDSVIKPQKGDSIMITPADGQRYVNALRLAIPMLFSMSKENYSVDMFLNSDVPANIVSYFLTCACPELIRESMNRGSASDYLVREAIDFVSQLPITMHFNLKSEAMYEEIQAAKPDVVFLECSHIHGDDSLIEAARSLAYQTPYLLLFTSKEQSYGDWADVILSPSIDPEDPTPICRAMITIPLNRIGNTTDVECRYDYRRSLFLPIDDDLGIESNKEEI